ncbi:MAG TPA: Asp-tRNA(Asn)/Glu-tRNA(Gln) amidotransferase subunit GatA [Candidatus Babeliales bacterium]|nr:Asp-tRNA(Asn)/Glu-tRNA(Gln) amidotransferase subunit GatA [Candidatus Babeliales bacterium]
MNNLAFAPIRELKYLLENNEISQQELLQFFLDRFTQYDSELGSALEVFDAASILARSSQTGFLAGIPGILKDNIAQQGRSLTCASQILKDFVSVYDATATKRLKAQGALLVGRANMDEFAMGSSTETSAFKKTSNPWDATRVAGGSSGGSIAAVAAGLVPWALGSDTGGSVRQPAAYCGIVGLKPTYGLVSRYGLVAYASSLDQIGIATRSVYDNALVLSAIAGHDVHDSSSLPVDQNDYSKTLDGALQSGLKIGVVEDALYAPGMDPEIVQAIERAIEQFTKLGAQIQRVSLPTLKFSAAAYFILSRAEAASNLSRFDGVRYGLRDEQAQTLGQMYSGSRRAGFGAEVKSRIMVGNYVLSAGHAADFYDNAKRVQQVIRHDFMKTFKDVDLLIMPTHPQAAFKFGAFDVDKLQMDLQDYFTCPINLAGVPAISLPCGFTKQNLPIGFQIVGPHLSEEALYKAAYSYETSTAWHMQHPKNF